MKENSQSASTLKQWLAICSVSLTCFCIILGEFLPVGLLGSVAKDMQVSQGTAGLMVTAPGLIAAFFTPGLVIFASKLNRRPLMIFLSVMLAVSSLISAITSSWTVMLISRLTLGIAVGGFYAIGTGLGRRLVREEHVARATAIIYAGVSLGLVLGTPIGTFIGQMGGWRAAFYAATAVSCIACIALFFTLPSIPSSGKVRLKDLTTLFFKPQMLGVLIAGSLVFFAQYQSYTFIEVFLSSVTHAGNNEILIALVIFGGIGIAGGQFGAYGVGRSLPVTVVVSYAGMAAGIAALVLSGAGADAAYISVAVWGFFFGIMPMVTQMWVLRVAEPAADAALALFVFTGQLSMACGAALGGVLVDKMGVKGNMSVSIAVLCVAIILTLMLLFKSRSGFRPSSQ